MTAGNRSVSYTHLEPAQQVGGVPQRDGDPHQHGAVYGVTGGAVALYALFYPCLLYTSAQPLLSYLSEENDAARFPVPKDDPMRILIGPENVADALKDTSVVMASYDIGEGMRGVIGVVGPTRMDYAKITARLSYLAEGLSKLFGQGQLPGGKDEET